MTNPCGDAGCDAGQTVTVKVSELSNPFAVINNEDGFALTTLVDGKVVDAGIIETENTEGLELLPASFVSTTLVTPSDNTSEIVVGGTQGYNFHITQSIGSVFIILTNH